VKLQRAELKRARIEIIPMIDTIFFLLVFFMITSLSMVQMSAKKVALPISTTANSKPVTKVVLTLMSLSSLTAIKTRMSSSSNMP